MGVYLAIAFFVVAASMPTFNAYASNSCAVAAETNQSTKNELSPEALERQSLELLDQLGLKTDEGSLFNGKLEYKWGFSKIVEGPGGIQLVVLRLSSYMDGTKGKEKPEFDVVVLKGNKVIPFEDAVEIPKSVVAKVTAVDFETRYPVGTSSYYVELTDRKSVISALKSTYAGIRYHGFWGYVVPGKAEFDPTPNRAWKVVDARFDLRRGSSAEVGDIQAFQLDSDFAAYTGGANHKETSTGEDGAWVAPWGQAAVVEIVKL